MSKDGSGDELNFKPVGEQDEPASGAQPPADAEAEVLFQPLGYGEAAGEGVSAEGSDVMFPGAEIPQALTGAVRADEQLVSAEQFVAPGSEGEPPAEQAAVGGPEPHAEAAGAALEQLNLQERPEAEEPESIVVAPEKELPEQKAEEEAEQKEEEEAEQKEARPSIFARLAEASPYTVLLGAAVVALAVGVIFLLLELKQYDFDIGAKKARQGTMERPAATSLYQSTIF